MSRLFTSTASLTLLATLLAGIQGFLLAVQRGSRALKQSLFTSSVCRTTAVTSNAAYTLDVLLAVKCWTNIKFAGGAGVFKVHQDHADGNGD
jgi:hypothetical protein